MTRFISPARALENQGAGVCSKSGAPLARAEKPKSSVMTFAQVGALKRFVISPICRA